ncbi:Metal-binding protein ZinT [Wohlfahrtiimonas chitiniclastica SH04]|uniref:Metal-binding protein ZinT n=1 Tax=Wohlfahrtiimonas chitiniclastica SH04 TaxID=1261130 RepID=L8XV51_9GAMM|nr:metal-binding protein ZinT [Wohlfahrtiimonas chitiniclastica]ELV07787.1 Metal-binding protein ZinT [Wohlfahrtiimonas chitiniclastica SH04]MBS7821493.1 metal-binding protein ZinT [Wohlfahrtiimonas chitiniclastica]
MQHKQLLLALSMAMGLSLSGAFAHGSHDHDHDHDHSHHHHGHHHTPMTEKQIQASKGYFEDQDVKDRSLSDWQGAWRSVYPLILSGELDAVMEKKAADKGDQTAQEYKAYYTKGYATDVENIVIDGNVIAFHAKEKSTFCEYAPAGHKILTYRKGNRGVRYLFECQQKDSGAPLFIQFSDHIIEPRAADHFHLYMGNESQEALFDELSNWPTYYPDALSNAEVVEEMLAH